MTDITPLTQELQDTIKKDMIQGYRDEEGQKAYPKLTEAATWYKVSYDSLKQKARKWNWRQKREEYQNKVKRKVAEKKEIDKLSESEAEAIVVEDIKFNRTANKLRREADKQLDLLDKGEVIIKVLEDGTLIKGRPSNTPYQLMNLGRALESAQKVSKLAAGEPTEHTKEEINGTIKQEPIDKFNNIMDKALEKLDEPVQHGE
ncbi:MULTISPECIES: hypothetical protein [Methanobacterium]|uniref:Uncharacterized protein n=1 Tax=Methanobacterium bryantii TaxID=2161 RepID=A0A2A2H8Z2_METBR|nr:MULTISPECIES: hypothetical protein [Methanobacterium]OEC87877.1 hypothetical protein A9507_06795 [Methanobacterium sp. A39]PAV05744.1 hypothetical protein ASJ80_08405 [Methanobacterium bryantii]